MTSFKQIWQGIFPANPVFRLMLGLVPAVGVTHLAWNGLFLGLTTTAVLVAALLILAVLSPVTGGRARVVTGLAALTVMTVIAQRVLVVSYPETVVGLGIYFPLIVVNGFVLLTISREQPLGTSLFTGLGYGLGFTLALTILGVVREFLGLGQVFGVPVVNWALQPFALAATVPGGMIVLALLMAAVNAVTKESGELNE